MCYELGHAHTFEKIVIQIIFRNCTDHNRCLRVFVLVFGRYDRQYFTFWRLAKAPEFGRKIMMHQVYYGFIAPPPPPPTLLTFFLLAHTRLCVLKCGELRTKFSNVTKAH